MRLIGEERGFGLFLLMAVRWRTVVNFSMRIQCHLIFPPSVPFTAKGMCNPVLLGYRWMGVLSPAEQQCQCWASWVHGSWLPFSWRRQSVVDHRRGLDIMFWHSSLLVTRFLLFSFFCLLSSVLFPELQAPIEAGRLWRVSTFLAGGCPAWRRR